jgi:endonuclease/exonuclease/phosphatase (EEP) superfamily protein YafD
MDHVLVDGPIEVLGATAHEHTSSDHLPLVVDLRLGG